ncbi:uncharacterized protein LOC113287438 [Papaver somniferum]|uniref:uncharacterized protein LOC113287438 n=1 Tax=Papaver somniferum TaxID=3469 RepID=UPI000E701862|nr:uncharacterized protein LOC113287438 [Papaver somniferum]
MNEEELIKKTKAVMMFLSSIENEADDIDEEMVKKVNIFVPEYFSGNKKTNKGDIKRHMLEAATDETRADDFVKFFFMFLLVSVFFPNKCGQTLAENYLYMVFDMNKVCWPEVFHDYLLDSLMTNRKDVENVVGCVIYPLYWLTEMTKIAQRKDGLDKYPRFARWNLSNICQQVLSNFEDLFEKTELWSEENIVHRKGSFLLQYDEKEMHLVEPIDEVDIVVEDYVEPEVPENEVPAPVEENVGASSEANNSYKAKYQWARSLIEKFRTNAPNVLSEEEESQLAKYDAEDRAQQPVQSTYLRRKRKQANVPIVPEAVSNREEDVEVITRDVNMIDASVVDRVIEQETVSLHDDNAVMEQGGVLLLGEKVSSFETRENSAQVFDNATMGQEKFSSKTQEDAAQTLADFLMQPEKGSTHGETQQDAEHQHESAKGEDPITLDSVFSDVDLTNLLKQLEGEAKEQVISSLSKPVTNDEQEREGTELTPNTIEDIKVAEQVESEMKKASSSKPVTDDEQQG